MPGRTGRMIGRTRIATGWLPVLISCILLWSCNDSGNRQNAAANIPDVNRNSGCSNGLDPLPPIGTTAVVGNGTSASCTEAALRSAIASLPTGAGSGTIKFNCGGPQTISLASALVVSGTLMIDGGNEITLSGADRTRVLELKNYTQLVVQQITIANGRTEDSGAGIYHPWYGTLRAIDVKFLNNHCTSEAPEVGGGAVFAGGLSEAIISGCTFAGNSASNGGGLFNRGSNLTVVNCVFSQNTSTSSGSQGQLGNGGGLYIDGMNYDNPGDFHLCGTLFERNHANQHGSALFSYFYEGSSSFIDRCEFRNNDFDGSPTGGAGGVYHEAAPLLLINSTIADNRSDQHAAGLFIGSGSNVDIINCTIANNRAPMNGAGIFDGASPVRIMSTTFSGNDADYGPAMFKGQSASVSVTNTIFANNTTSNQYSALACHETLSGGGGNIQWPSTKNNGKADMPCVSGILFADPLLQPLADNGGPTRTMALTQGSPAINAAGGCRDTDQRGMGRVGACDSGSFEFQSPASP